MWKRSIPTTKIPVISNFWFFPIFWTTGFPFNNRKSLYEKLYFVLFIVLGAHSVSAEWQATEAKSECQIFYELFCGKDGSFIWILRLHTYPSNHI